MIVKLNAVFHFASLSTIEIIERIMPARIKGAVRIFTDHTMSPNISMRVPNPKPTRIFSQRRGRKTKKLAIKLRELNAIAIVPAAFLLLKRIAYMRTVWWCNASTCSIP